MKYAIRLSHLPPCVIYADIQRDASEILAWLNGLDVDSPFTLAIQVYNGLHSDILANNVQLVEDKAGVVFTDTKGVDILITKFDGKFEIAR